MSDEFVYFYCEECEKETLHVNDIDFNIDGEYVCNECKNVIQLDEDYKRIM
ncbi:hypothetical protein [Type-E symbiont of Plautia stali]|uniref:hypothetical protein n=1 Tax=Type-E symbiont of Plautia stali TaxID=1560357 RepID=UPI00142897D0|nr:hypothetical protein [Type-E symbiont of Plautia stali]